MSLKSKQRYTEITVTATGNTNLTTGGALGGIMVEIDRAGDASITFQARLENSDGPWQTIAYLNMASGAYASSALIADSLVLVPAQGLQVRMAATATTGSTVVRYTPVLE